MSIYDRRNKSYEWTAFYDCPNPDCRKTWGVLMEFNNGANFVIDRKFDENCPECGTEGRRVSETEMRLREQERWIESKRGK